MTIESTEKLTLSLPASIKAMIKADAKALGMTPSSYVSMVCRSLNEEARSDGMTEFIQVLTKEVTQSAAKALAEK